MRQFIHRHIVLPVYETVLHGRKNFRHWKELERTQWLPRAEVERIQLMNLRRLLAHAYQNCPYYRDTWRSLGLPPEGPRSVEDFRRWPVIGRDTIREHREQMRAQVPHLRLIPKSTGGSSGVPLHFDYDMGSEERRYGAYYRGYGWAGAAPGTRQLWLWGVPIGERPFLKEWKDRLYHTIYGRRILNSFELSEQRVPEFLAKLNRHRPDVIVAYTNPLYTFARQLRERGLKPFSPKSIIVGAEKLYDFQRELIEGVFNAPVFETYGSREFMLIGAECDRHEGLHLTMEHLLVEVLDDDWQATADGEEGNVVITDLFNYGMPFVRYANGDRAIAGWGTCSCGRGLPLLKKVVGRQLDVIHTPDGRRVPGELFPHLMKDFTAIKRFVVVQDEPDHLEVRVVISPAWKPGDREAILNRIGGIVGPALRLDLLEVGDIPLTAVGKHRVVINRCGPTEPPHDTPTPLKIGA
jgi:phenylacetate-CoA ligase